MPAVSMGAVRRADPQEPKVHKVSVKKSWLVEEQHAFVQCTDLRQLSLSLPYAVPRAVSCAEEEAVSDVCVCVHPKP